MSDTPSNDDLSAIQRAIPHLNKLASDRKGQANRDKIHKLIKEKGNPCMICLEPYKIISQNKQLVAYCPNCCLRLENGEQAVTCVSGRFAFLKSDDSPEANKISAALNLKWPATQIPYAVMNMLTAKHKSQHPDAEAN